MDAIGVDLALVALEHREPAHHDRRICNTTLPVRYTRWDIVATKRLWRFSCPNHIYSPLIRRTSRSVDLTRIITAEYDSQTIIPACDATVQTKPTVDVVDIHCESSRLHLANGLHHHLDQPSQQEPRWPLEAKW